MPRAEDFADGADKSQRAPLTDSQKKILDFGRQTWTHIGHRENAIRATFDMSSTSYFQRLHSLLDHPEAVAYAPEVVRRANETIARGQSRMAWREREDQ